MDRLIRPIILFADDDPLARAIARKVAAELNVTILLAEDGEKALELVHEHRPDVLVTDALMPKLDGREVSKVAKDVNANTKVILITSVYKDPRYKYEAYKEFKVDEYVVKPITPDKLRDLFAKYTGK
jgi:two-component system, response regulator YesN